MEQTFMKEKKILPLLLSMALPSMISMLVGALYNIVDGLFVARISEEAMTALSLVFPMQNISLAISVGFGIGVGALISVSMGMQQQKRADRAASSALGLCALHGLLVTIFGIAATPYFLRMFTDNAEVIRMGQQYANVVFLFCIPQHLSIGVEKIFQSVGRMKSSMAGMLTGSITNLILDPILIFGLGPIPALGIHGAALATGLGQVASLAMYGIQNRLNPIPVHFSGKSCIPEKNMLARMYSVGIPASLNIALPSLLISALNSILAAYSQIYIVVLGVYYKLQTFVYMPANGLVQGMRPILGYNYGAGESERVKKIFRAALSVSALIMLSGTAVCMLFPSALIGLFSENPDTIREGVIALGTISIGFAASSVSITCCGALEGLGMGMQSLMTSLMRFVVVIIPLAFVLSRTFGPHGVWHAFWLTECISAVISFVLYRTALAKKLRQISNENI